MKHFDTQMQEFQFSDKYARWDDKKGRRETWGEAVDRSVSFLIELSENKLPEEDYEDIRDAMINMEAFPSMRLFAMAGDAARRDNTVIYNCSYLAVDSILSMAEALYLSMSGCGVGYSVESKSISLLPVVGDYDPRSGNDFMDIFFKSGDTVYTIPDTQQGWANSFLIGLSAWFAGQDIEFDFSSIRPKGSILKTKGGRASGGGVLKTLLETARQIIQNADGRKLTSLEVHDIMTTIGDCARSGGSRRSAMIALFDENDQDMLHSKDNGWWKTAPQRANANNSIVIDSPMERDDIKYIMEAMNAGGGGEPGFYLRHNAVKFSPRRELDGYEDYGLNPCQPDFAHLLTPSGIEKMGDIRVGDMVWSEDGWVKVVNKISTGVKPVYEYLTTGGRFVGTENHRLVSHGEKQEAAYCDSIDILACDEEFGRVHDHQAVMDGIVLGDGSVHMASKDKVYLTIGNNDSDYHESELAHLINGRHAAKHNAWKIETTISPDELPYTYDRVIPSRFYYGDSNTVASFLRGLYTANGSVVRTRVTLKATSFKIILQVQDMLSSIGIRSYYTINKPSMVLHHNGEFMSKQSYDLNITSDREIFRDLIGFVHDYKQEKLDQACTVNSNKGVKNHDIVSVTYLGDFDVYDITVDGDSHTYWTSGVNVSNCGEINLRNKQFCNLSQVIARPDDTIGSLKRKVRLATIIGTIQSSATNFKFIRDEWKENTEEERLLGVDITGQMDSPHLFAPEVLTELREYAIRVNDTYAKELGINPSAAVTCNKPSGNSSVLFGCSAGLHSRWSDYYIRRVRINAHSPMLQLFQYYNVPLFPENGQSEETANTFVAEFPVKAPDGAITNGSRSAVTQLEWWKMNKVYWTEHNPSCTISYTENELPDMIDWLHDNQDIIGGLSFLPYNDHYYPLAPYEAIDEVTYNEMVSAMPEIDFGVLADFENEDNTTGAQELACSSGVCEI